MLDLRDIAEQSLLTLKDYIEQGAEARGKNATGKTVRSIRIAALGTDTMATGTLSMDASWRFFGNGRGPGKMPPKGNIEAWIMARGYIHLNAFVVARNIAARGTFDYRQRRTNIVEDEIKAWQEKEGIKIDEAMVDAAYARTIDIYKRA